MIKDLEVALVQVLVRFNNIEYFIKALRKEMQKEGIFRSIKAKRYYIKPSEKKALKDAESQRRIRKISRAARIYG